MSGWRFSAVFLTESSNLFAITSAEKVRERRHNVLTRGAAARARLPPRPEAADDGYDDESSDEEATLAELLKESAAVMSER